MSLNTDNTDKQPPKLHKCPKCRAVIMPGKEVWERFDGVQTRRLHPICQDCYERMCLYQGGRSHAPKQQHNPGRAQREYDG